jgi:hypothetical protein
MSDELPPLFGDKPNLKEIFERSLADYYSVNLAVFYTPEVVLPEFLRTPEWKAKADIVRLEYGLDMPVPITDMVVTDDGVAATLSFSRVPCSTYVPWKAVMGLAAEGKRETKTEPTPKKRPSFLKLVE